jgi:hypothetical protein
MGAVMGLLLLLLLLLLLGLLLGVAPITWPPSLLRRPRHGMPIGSCEVSSMMRHQCPSGLNIGLMTS